MSELFRLDAPVNPGLKITQFRELFRRCACGLVTTRRAFAFHFCIDQVDQLRRYDGRHTAQGETSDDEGSVASTITNFDSDDDMA